MADIVYKTKFKDYENSGLFSGYAYSIPKETIDHALTMLRNETIYALVKSEIGRNWQEAFALNENTLISDDMKDALRIAMLVLLIRNEGLSVIIPVNIDTFSLSLSCLEGHHRLLALKYLGYVKFPVYLSGDIDILESNLHVSMKESYFSYVGLINPK